MGEEGKKKGRKGKSKVENIRDEEKKEKGKVKDRGTERITRNGKEDRYGPQTNTKEGFITIARRKSDPKDTVEIIDCDQSLLTIEFEEGKYRNWQDARYQKTWVNQLSHFFRLPSSLGLHMEGKPKLRQRRIVLVDEC